MRIKSYKKGKKNTYYVELEDCSIYIFYDDIILKSGLLVKKEISKKELENLQKENRSLEAYYVGLDYLTKKMHTEKEVKDYLTKKGYAKESIESALLKYQKEKIINEEAYTEAYIHDAWNFGKNGPEKIKKQLLALGIEEDRIDCELSTIEKKDWLNRLEALILKRKKANHKDSLFLFKQKAVEYFVNEGYYKSWVIELLENLEEDKEEEALAEKELKKILVKLERKNKGNVWEEARIKLLKKGFKSSTVSSVIAKEKEIQ